MSSILSLDAHVHARALEVSSSLFNYAVEDLGLSEGRTYSLITVARKAREVPALKEKIGSGTITLSGARRIASVLRTENQKEWLEKAETLSARQLEKEIVRVSPREATRERAIYDRSLSKRR